MALGIHHWEVTFQDGEGTWTWTRFSGTCHDMILFALTEAHRRKVLIHHFEQLDAWDPRWTYNPATGKRERNNNEGVEI